MDTASFICITMVLLPYAENPAAGHPEAVVREAFVASSRQLTSGRGIGKFRQFRRDDKGDKWVLTIAASVKSYFAAGKYHIHLTYSQEPLRLTERIIVFDGTALASSEFSGQISVTQNQAHVYEARRLHTGVVRPLLAGFPWDISKLGAEVCHVPKMIDNLSPRKIEFRQTEAGGYTGSCRLEGGSKVILECPREFGYNVSGLRVLREGQPEPDQEYVATWKKKDGVWYIDSITETFRGEDRGYRWELKYDDFVPNAAVPPRLFTLAALQMRSGSRLIDHRPRTKRPIHYIPVEDEVMERAMDSMIDQIRALPTERPTTNAGQNPPRKELNTWLIVINVLLVVVLVAFVMWRNRRNRGEPK